jgi:hypothetical protein
MIYTFLSVIIENMLCKNLAVLWITLAVKQTYVVLLPSN